MPGPLDIAMTVNHLTWIWTIIAPRQFMIFILKTVVFENHTGLLTMDPDGRCLSRQAASSQVPLAAADSFLGRLSLENCSDCWKLSWRIQKNTAEAYGSITRPWWRTRSAKRSSFVFVFSQWFVFFFCLSELFQKAWTAGRSCEKHKKNISFASKLALDPNPFYKAALDDSAIFNELSPELRSDVAQYLVPLERLGPQKY